MVSVTTRVAQTLAWADVKKANFLLHVLYRIYVDAIINHMSGMGRSGTGTGGTEFDADLGHFPGVPYEMDNFNDCSNCPSCCCINAWTDTTAVSVLVGIASCTLPVLLYTR